MEAQSLSLKTQYFWGRHDDLVDNPSPYGGFYTACIFGTLYPKFHHKIVFAVGNWQDANATLYNQYSTGFELTPPISE